MNILEAFYKLMYRTKTVKYKCVSGDTYIMEYHRERFWTYEAKSVWHLFKEKFTWWNGQVWRVYNNGSKCGFGTCYYHALFPRRFLKKFLINEANRLDDIFNNENS